MRPSDLDDSVLEDLSDLEADLDRINLDSPLHILSPNKLLAEHEGGTNPWKGRPCSAGPLEEENKGGEQRLDDLAAAQHTEDTVPSLPSFSRKKAIDPRRQSTAIFSALKLSSSGAGLLEDSEIALAPDEDILIPLNRSIPFSLTQKSTLWIDPNNEELLDVNLPEPEHFLYEEPQKSPEGQGKEESVQMGRNSENERFKSPPREDIKECCGPSMPSEDASVDQVVSSKSSKGFLKPSRLRAPSSSSRFFQSSTSQHNSR